MERGTAIDIGLLHPMPGKTMALATCVVAIAVHNQVGDNVRGAEQSLKPAEKGANPVPASALTGAGVNRCIRSKNLIRNAMIMLLYVQMVIGQRGGGGRVGKHVKIRGVAVSLKKKKKTT